jgi:hypothetical protein
MIQIVRLMILVAVVVVVLQMGCKDSGTNPGLGQFQALGLTSSSSLTTTVGSNLR